ncbi:MAG: threonylcarbamoyl-AMP synthase [Elusimicrobia bacterium RIFOXYA2_FULL_39_19]|nr:MAG: threonylcarbamoyl-AMP synthase [Elusimicrobia bacterium RIFOXYA2_FULL_39_19]
MNLIKINLQENLTRLIAPASTVIKKGGVVIFPTETVYGIGADAFNETAIKRIFEIKGRPENNPLSIHIASKEAIKEIAVEVPDFIYKIIDNFLPGPLTIVLKKNPAIPAVVTAGKNTVGIRFPAHTVALEFIKQSGCYIAAPSANFSEQKSPQSIAEIPKELLEKTDFVLDAGLTGSGISSTVVDFTVSPPKILRQGKITLEELKKFIPFI